MCLCVYADGHITEGTLMIFKVVHLRFKILQPCNERSKSSYNRLMHCEEFTVRPGLTEDGASRHRNASDRN